MFIVENLENTHTRKNKSKHFTSTEVITPNIFLSALLLSVDVVTFREVSLVSCCVYFLMATEHPS